jgi:hypothetical protein
MLESMICEWHSLFASSINSVSGLEKFQSLYHPLIGINLAIDDSSNKV